MVIDEKIDVNWRLKRKTDRRKAVNSRLYEKFWYDVVGDEKTINVEPYITVVNL